MSDVLQGSGRSGDFVHAGQKMAKEDGFGKVSKIWYDKTQSYDDGFAHLEAEADKREDLIASPEHMVPVFDEDEGKCYFEYVDGRRYTPTPHALRQYGTRAYIPHTWLNEVTQPKLKPNGEVRFQRDAGDAFTLFQVLKNGHRRMKDDQYRWRTDTDGTLRACLTSMYAPIDNRWYLENLKRIIPGGRLSHMRYCTADTFAGNILIPDTIREEDDSDYGGMLSCGNCEIGTKPFFQYPSVFRAICMNGCIWDQTKGHIIKVVHRRKEGIDLVILAKKLADNIQSQIPLLTKGVELLLDLRDWTINTDIATRPQVIATVARDNNLTGKQTVALFSNWAKFGKHQPNAFGVVDALTRTGQEFDVDTWTNLDRAAGRLIIDKRVGWEKLLKRASTFDDKDMEKLQKHMAKANVTAA